VMVAISRVSLPSVQIPLVLIYRTADIRTPKDRVPPKDILTTPEHLL